MDFSASSFVTFLFNWDSFGFKNGTINGLNLYIREIDLAQLIFETKLTNTINQP